MFLGEYEYKIDEKGRVPIPPRFREESKQGLVLARGLERCIVIYPLSEWKKIAENLATLPPARAKERRINRFTFSTSFEAELDPQGRIALPLPLRQYSEIKESIVIAGVNNYLELWSKEHWESEKAFMTEEAWQISESAEERR